MGPRIFFHTFSMALYQKWDVKNYFAYVLQFFSLISDTLGSVPRIFRLFMEGIFDGYVLWPLDKKVQNWIVDRSTAHEFKIIQADSYQTILTLVYHAW